MLTYCLGNFLTRLSPTLEGVVTRQNDGFGGAHPRSADPTRALNTSDGTDFNRSLVTVS